MSPTHDALDLHRPMRIASDAVGVIPSLTSRASGKEPNHPAANVSIAARKSSTSRCVYTCAVNFGSL